MPCSIGCPWDPASCDFASKRKRPIVDDDSDREAVVQRLGSPVAATKTAVYVWALNFSHAHILSRNSEIGISGFMRRLLSRRSPADKKREL
jgi:hypothetical protein